MQKKYSQRVPFGAAVLLGLLLTLLTACSSIPLGSGGQPSPTPAGSKGVTATPTSGTGGTVAMPPTDTSCPAPNTARAAVIRPLALGSHPNLVYVYNEVPPNTSIAYGHVRRYDTVTGQKVDLATSGIRIDQAQVSNDGQWVLFLSIPDPRGDSQHSAMLQLVRMDGKGLQTLYCFGKGVAANPRGYIDWPVEIQWSTDEKSILFSVYTTSETSQIFLLDVASGSLHQLFQGQHDAFHSYDVITWLDNTHFYVRERGINQATTPDTVFLMNAKTATVAHPGLASILSIGTNPGQGMGNYSLDSSPDGAKLYVASGTFCQLPGPFSTPITAGPAQGGARTTIFHGTPQDCVQTVRALSTTKLLVLAQVATEAGNAASSDVWTLSTTPGSNYNVVSLLSVTPSDPTLYAFNQTSQFTWSNVSRDGSFYALQAINPNAQTQSIMIGSLSGGNAQAVASTASGLSTVSLAGWTTM